MRILISGASGLIGKALVSHLTDQGHEILQLVRRPAKSSGEVSWNPKLHELDISKLGIIDAVINLSGAGVGDRRWTKSYKSEILNSRVDSTATLVTAIHSMPVKPKVLLNASAILVAKLTNGIASLTNISPIGAIDNLNLSIAP